MFSPKPRPTHYGIGVKYDHSSRVMKERRLQCVASLGLDAWRQLDRRTFLTRAAAEALYATLPADVQPILHVYEGMYL